MRILKTTLGALLIFAAACTNDRDDKRSSGIVTAPGRPSLTVKTLPADASTVCIATVRKRDQLLAKSPTADHAALDAAIDDICQ